MIELLGRLAHRLFPVLARRLVASRTLAFGYGQARSIRLLEAVDADGAPIPWYTYPAIDYLRQFDLRSASVFEFGSGNSSRFWAARAARVVAVENNPAWHAALAAAAPANLELHLRAEKAAYLECLAEQGAKFDLLVIDGRWRRSCARLAPGHLADGGMIVLDNTDWHPQAARELRNAGYYQIDFSGFGPINAYTWTTSLFLRANARLQQGIAGPQPIGAMAQNGEEDQ